MHLVKSSTIVKKNLKPSTVLVANGPQRSQWSKSKGLVETWVLAVKGSFFCFEKWQISQQEVILLILTSCTSCFNNWSLEWDGCPNLLCHKADEEMEETAEAKTDAEDLQSESCNRNRPLCALPRPIVLHWARSWIKQQSPRKMRQQQSDLVSLLTKIKLNVKEGTHKTLGKIKVEEICTVPIYVTKACSPFGK